MSTTSRDFFERIYRADPDPWSFSTSEYERHRYARTLQFVPPNCFRNVFEPGCSIGVLTVGLAARCGHVTAIDIAGEAVEVARERCRGFDNVDVHQGSVVKDIPADSFDLVVFSELGYYFDEPQLVEIGTRLASRIEERGQLLAVHWTGHSPDHVLSGDHVHRVLGEHLALQPLHHETRRWDERDGFVLDIWRKPAEGEELGG